MRGDEGPLYWWLWDGISIRPTSDPSKAAQAPKRAVMNMQEFTSLLEEF